MIVTGTITRPDAACSFMIDTTTAQLVQLGGEDKIVAQDIGLIAEILQIDPTTIEELQDMSDPSTSTRRVTDTFTKGDVTITLTYPEED